MPTLRYWTGTSWELLSLGGTGGGTTVIAVSSDPNNASRLGSDGKVFTPLISPSVTAPLQGAGTAQVGVSANYAREDHQHPFPTPAQIGAAAVGHTHKFDDLTDVVITVPAAGQTVRFDGTNFVNTKLAYTDLTGLPTIPAAPPAASTTIPLADGTSGAVGVLTTYARGDHVHPRPTQSIRQINQATYTLAAADVGNIVWNVFATGDATILLPADASVAIPVGSTIFILADTAFKTLIQPITGGIGLYWPDKNASGAPIKGGGSGTLFSTYPVGILTMTQVVKVAPNTWYHFPN